MIIEKARGQAELRAAVIGLGVGERHIAGYQADPRCNVVALCDIDAGKLSEVSTRHPEIPVTTDPNEVLFNPAIDVISIASYDDVHRAQIIAALKNGKHVFVEKPLCLTRDEYDDIVVTLESRQNLQLSSNLILRKVPRFQELRRRLREGRLGKIYYLEGDYDYGRLHKITKGWRGRLKNYSVVHGGGIHLIDLLLWLTGKRIIEVFAYGNRLSTQGSQFKNADMVVAVLKFSDDVVAKVSANFASVTPHHHRLCVYGTEGSFVQGHMGAAYLWSRDPNAPHEPAIDPYPGTAKGDMLPSFIRSILDDEAADVTVQEVFDAMNVSLAIEESLETGEPVALNYVNLRS